MSLFFIIKDKVHFNVSGLDVNEGQILYIKKINDNDMTILMFFLNYGRGCHKVYNGMKYFLRFV